MSRTTPWLTALVAFFWLSPVLANDPDVDSSTAEITDIKIVTLSAGRFRAAFMGFALARQNPAAV